MQFSSTSFKNDIKSSFFAAAVILVGLFQTVNAQEIPNYPIPQNPDTLRILGIGNSFTDDGMMYLPDLLKAAGIGNVILGRLYIGGCSLERHWKEYSDSSPAYKYYKSENNCWVTVSNHATMMQGLEDEHWDIVVLQQQSSKAGIYETFQPWLDELMEVIRMYCPNAGACIAWQETWAYAPMSTNPGFVRFDKDQDLMYRSIMNAAKEMLAKTSIKTIIPTGTAIRNLRMAEKDNPSECDSLEFTRDGYHLNYRLGRYTAACTWFQALIAPSLRTNVYRNAFRLNGKIDAKKKTPLKPLSDEEAEACQTAAMKACASIFSTF
ncbi:MAG: DUF4886 domain-containing protein [Bacteroidales bacterium]|jgi:hypothetical protein|nr:DUF4886 domain-containing protein [Bacteroidales bacterium]MCI2121686.1 DUF4886 domain-containing protein [Bacteroidales bacterium]MCI2144889.1 DUF4886 domain-containing protein [Bacteroidales bacterium]